MSPLEPLAPDQRAVVALVLQQGRSYDEIAELLGIPVDAVRARAQAGLAALASGQGLPVEITAPLADYLLGQQPAADAESTRGLLAESGPARAWASDVAERLSDVAKSPLPEIPADGAGPSYSAASSATSSSAPADLSSAPAGSSSSPAESSSTRVDDPSSAAVPAPGPRPRPVRETAGEGGSPLPASSKVGGVLLIAAVVAVVAVVLFVVLSGGDEQPASSNAGAAAATATATPTPAPQVADRITLHPAAGGKAKGTMTVFLQGDQLLFALQGENLAPSSDSVAYAVWLTGPGAKARRLGFTSPVGADGKLGIQGPSQKDLAAFPRMYATYANVVVSQESTGNAKRPTRIVLTGKLPKGR